MGGGALPKADLSASLVSGQSRRFLVYQNYDALLQYNCAHAYALSVAILGERLASNGPIIAEQSNAARQPRRASARRARR
jgi:membrane-bound lytic murein transglycosylase B